MKKIILSGLLMSCLVTITAMAQDPSVDDAKFIRKIYDAALTNSNSYTWLEYLSLEIGARLSGSPEAAAAVEFTKQMMDTLGLDEVRLQEVMVPHWVRGDKEIVRIVNSSRGDVNFHVLALGNSIGTGPEGLVAEVIEVHGVEELGELGRENIEGKIVFYNRPMDGKHIHTFRAYGGAVDQRVWGAAEAAQYGAVATLVRSMTTSIDYVPHTGVQIYKEGIPQISATAISTKDAELLSDLLEKEKVKIYIRSTCHMLEEKLSYNVIGEIRGSEFPDEIILVGGHLDAWDVGHGSHDDGAGCVQSMDVLALLRQLNYQPKRTLRAVMFMNEENGGRGAKKYWETSNEKGEYHLAAIESDAGGFSPRGFSCDADKSVFDAHFGHVKQWESLFKPYGVNIYKGGSGADIGAGKSQKGILFGLRGLTPKDISTCIIQRSIPSIKLINVNWNWEQQA
jgi:carboxypeptidase Q